MLRSKVAMNYVACFKMNSVCWYCNMKANENLINRQVLRIWATNIGYDWLESWIMSGERWNEILIKISSHYRRINMAITWLNNNSLKTITRYGISFCSFLLICWFMESRYWLCRFYWNLMWPIFSTWYVFSISKTDFMNPSKLFTYTM